MGRFIPIVRTFAPIIAGIVRLDFNKFAFYNISGAFLWITSLTLLGFYLGRSFEQEINDYLLFIIVGFILITAIPLIVTYLKRKIEGDRSDEEEQNP
jgi:membrane-associated protein